MRRLSFELSFLRQSYICAPALSAGQVDGIKFRSGPFPCDRNSLLFAPRIPRGYISRRETERRLRDRPGPGENFGRRWSRIGFRRRDTNARYKGIPSGAINFTIATRSLLSPACVAYIKAPLETLSIEKRYTRRGGRGWNKKVSCNSVIISFSIGICVRALRAFHEEWRSMNVDAINERGSFHFRYTWRRYDPSLMGGIDKRGMTRDWVIDQCHRHARIPSGFLATTLLEVRIEKNHSICFERRYLCVWGIAQWELQVAIITL